MKIEVKARFLSSRLLPDPGTFKGRRPIVYCFKHAVIAIGEGDNVEMEIDDFGSENDFRWTICDVCSGTINK